MQFRCLIGLGGGIMLDPVDTLGLPVSLGGPDISGQPLFREYYGQLFAVTGYEEVSSRLGSGDGGPEKRHIIEVGSQLKLRQCLIGRFDSDWTDEPIVDAAFALLDYQVAAFTWIQLNYLLQEMVRGMGVSKTILSVGTQCVLETLEESIKRGELDDNERVIEAVFRLGVNRSELSQFSPGVLVLIPEIVATSARFRAQLDETLLRMAAALEAAKKRSEEDAAVLMRQLTQSEALQLLYEQWQKAQLAAEADAH